jgi:hypothetical protein
MKVYDVAVAVNEGIYRIGPCMWACIKSISIN